MLWLNDVCELLEEFLPEPKGAIPEELKPAVGIYLSYALEFCFEGKIKFGGAVEPYTTWSNCRAALEDFLKSSLANRVGGPFVPDDEARASAISTTALQDWCLGSFWFWNPGA